MNTKKKNPSIFKILSVILIISFIVKSVIDYVNYNPIATSAPYYVNLIINVLSLLIPAIIVFVIGVAFEKVIYKAQLMRLFTRKDK